MIDAQEYAVNHELQKLFENAQLPDVPLYKVKFVSGSRMTPQQFFFYQSKWRNTDSKSEFGAVTFDEHEIRQVIYWT